MNHVTIGVYSNEEYKVNIVKDSDLDGHIKYNKVFRPGRMLFVDGKYTVGGMEKDEYKQQRIKEWEEKISKMQIDSSVVSEMYY